MKIEEHNYYSDRKPCFENDLKIGKIGESDFKIHFPRMLIDISNEIAFKNEDIDFVEPLIDVINENEFILYLKNTKDFTSCIKYEVKSDTISLRTHNFFYESVCFWKTGCSKRSIADWIYYVLLSNNYDIVDRYLINNKKWKEWVEINKHNKNKIKIPKKSKMLSEGKDGFLCSIQEMLNDKICYKVIVNKQNKLATIK